MNSVNEHSLTDPSEAAALEQYRLALGTAVISAVAIAGFVAIYFVAAMFGNEAAFFPQIVAVVGAVSGAAALIFSAMRTVKLRHTASSLRAAPFDWKDWFITYGGPPLYGLMIFVLGFWLASALGMLGLLFTLGERRPLVGISVAGGTLLLIYVVFDLSFSIRMPGSLLYDLMRG